MPKIITAENAGFCFGVRRAVESVFDVLDKYTTIYTYGELIHNKSVINVLNSKGVRILDEKSLKSHHANESRNNNKDLIVIRSHGVSEQIYQQIEATGYEILDLTCPFVKRIHNKVHSTDKDIVIIVGAENHPEVLGIRGWTDKTVYICYSIENAQRLPSFKNALAVAQTTITSELWTNVTLELSKKIDNLELFNSICDTTQKRQQEAQKLSKNSDVVIVVGGRHSSNTEKLYEICRNNCKKTYYVENAEEIFLDNIHKHGIISIVAGASTPDWLIREVRRRMSDVEMTQDNILQEDIRIDDNPSNTSDIESITEDVNITGEPEIVEETIVEDSQTTENEDSAHMEDFEAELEKSLVSVRRGQIINGTVVQVSDDEICVNIGYKSDGIIKKENLTAAGDVNPRDLFKVDDEIEAEVVSLNDGEGNVVLSRKSIESKLKWKELVENLDTEAIYNVKVYKVVKGGVLAKLDGYDAFIPASHLSSKYVEDLSEFIDKNIDVNILEADKRQRRFVLSHKKMLQKQAEENEKKLYGSFNKGDKIQGKVKRLTDFGAFVDVGGVDGLLHITDIAWKKIKHPSEILNVGDVIDVQVLNVDPEKKRISLGYKQLQPKPWDLVSEKYSEGDIVQGTVVRIMPFGAFVSLEPTIDGLIHISQVANRRLEKVEEELRIGDKITAKIMEVNPAKKRISLSIKALNNMQEKEKDEKPEKVEYEDKFHYEIPPVEEATSTLGDFFPKLDEEE